MKNWNNLSNNNRGSNFFEKCAIFIAREQTILSCDENYVFDKIGNFVSVSRILKGTSPLLNSTENIGYLYNSTNNRLRSSNTSGTAPKNAQYTYDGNGNLLTHTGKSISNTVYTRSTYASELTLATSTVNYGYDVGDLRIYKRKNSNGQLSEEFYFKDVFGKDIVIVTIQPNNSELTEFNVFGANKIASIDLSASTNVMSPLVFENELTFYLYDHLGNNRMAFGLRKTPIRTEYQLRYVADYLPYGKVLRSYSDGSNSDRYPTTGHERDDETGLDYRGARFYDSEIGRFLSVDPWAAKYAAWSTYNYVMGNPIIFTDPTGKGVETETKDLQESAKQKAEASTKKSGWTKNHLYLNEIFGDPNELSSLIAEKVEGDDKKKKAPENSESRVQGPPTKWENGDGYIELSEAVYNYRYGEGQALNADIRKLDLSKIHASDFKGGVGSLMYFNFAGAYYTNKTQALVYGNVGFMLLEGNKVYAMHDYYDFDLKLVPGSLKRDVLTLLGAAFSGFGTPYHINFYGIATIKP